MIGVCSAGGNGTPVEAKNLYIDLDNLNADATFNNINIGVAAGDSTKGPGIKTGDKADPGSFAQEADSARRADSALVAATAVEAEKLSGHSAACDVGTRYFAGSCWETVYVPDPLTAPAAAEACADRGGELPQALTLAAFAGEPGIAIAGGGEWTSEIPTTSGLNKYALAIVLPTAEIDTALSTAEKKFRCVIPLLS